MPAQALPGAGREVSAVDGETNDDVDGGSMRMGIFYPSTPGLHVASTRVAAENPNPVDMAYNLAVARVCEAAGLDYLFLADRWAPYGENCTRVGFQDPMWYPPVLLADEPTGNLDPEATNNIMKILDYINSKGTTVIMATHDRNIIKKMNKRVIELKEGRIVSDKSPTESGPVLQEV